MSKTSAIAAVAVLSLSTPAFAHQLDEYLQATTVTVSGRGIGLQLRLTPGVGVARRVLDGIDLDRDGTFSEAERRDYVERVRRDLAVVLDGRPLELRSASSAFPEAGELTKGLASILVDFEVETTQGGPDRRLTIENRHQASIAAYIVNCLRPRDPSVFIVAQARNYGQSSYRLDFRMRAAPEATQVTPVIPGSWQDRAGSLSVMGDYIGHGVRHILTGYDHMLFIGILALAAATWWDLVKVVTAFTLAHTITLTLATLDVVRMPGCVVEPVIAASIVFVAAQNLFWPGASRGRGRLVAAFFFGLFHGMGFADGLLDAMQGLPSGTVALAIIGFSIGVEAGHQMILLPICVLLTAARRFQPRHDGRARFSIVLQRVGSAAILTAGVYYVCIALAGNS